MTKAPASSKDTGAFKNDSQQRHSIQTTQRTGAVRNSGLAVIAAKDEPRIDSRLLAQHLGSRHKTVFESIRKYRDDFRSLALLPFQTEVFAGRGQPEKFALLTEDQCYLLLTYSRNSAKVRPLKVRLVQAFREARRAAEQHRAEYLPSYHALHDEIQALAAGSSNAQWVHANFNKLLNKTVGIESGQRGTAYLPQQAMLTVAQAVAAKTVHGAADHRDAYQRAKAAMAALSAAVLIDDQRGAAHQQAEPAHLRRMATLFDGRQA